MKKLVFVVQEHNASHLHYDFRLEVNGVMVSWAVPKLITPDTKIKRLAVKVGDHTMAYNKFEGTIPKGKYGAGTVKTWDKGLYQPKNKWNKPSLDKEMEAQLEKGSVSILLYGKVLKGKWNLMRLKDGINWILSKGNDNE